MNKPTDRTIFQNAWVVENLEEACMKWVNEMGVGPFFITDYAPTMFDAVHHRSSEAVLVQRVANRPIH